AFVGKRTSRPYTKSENAAHLSRLIRAGTLAFRFFAGPWLDEPEDATIVCGGFQICTRVSSQRGACGGSTSRGQEKAFSAICGSSSRRRRAPEICTRPSA